MDEDLIKITGGIVLLIVLLIAGVFYLDKMSCLQSYESYKPQWGIVTGCRIEVDGKLTPVYVYREIKSN